MQETSVEKAYIPLKTKLKIEGVDYAVNEEGIPYCPHDPSLVMKREGSKSHLRCGLPTMKFVCPKMKWEYNKTQVNPNGSAIVKIPVRNLPVAG